MREIIKKFLELSHNLCNINFLIMPEIIKKFLELSTSDKVICGVILFMFKYNLPLYILFVKWLFFKILAKKF